MTKEDFIKRERDLDVLGCSNQDIVKYITMIQETREGKSLTWDFRKHVAGWQILKVDQINENVPVVHFTGEILFQDPADFREPSIPNGDLFQVTDAEGETRLILVLDFAFLSEDQRVQFQAIGVAVNPLAANPPGEEEIAQMMKRPVGTIKARISRGREHLKNILEKDEHNLDFLAKPKEYEHGIK